MERLTDRTEDGLICLNNNGNCGFIEQLIKAIGKLAAFECFMEERGFESLGELESVLYQLNVKASKTKELGQEKQALKARWGKLKDFIYDFKKYNIEEANLAWKILKKMKELEE